ncbi:MAG: bestrophin family ion channel [Myxococcota bacterium]
MIVPNTNRWHSTLLYWRGTTLRRTWPRIVLVTAVAGVVTYLHEQYGFFEKNMTPTPFALVGLALSIFLGFRNNTSYDRFWEGRKLWGALVNQARSTTRQVVTLIGDLPGKEKRDHHELHEELAYGIAGYVHSLRLHLRDEDPLEELEPFFDKEFVDSLVDEHNRPIAILAHLGRRFRRCWDDGLVDTMHLPLLESSLQRLTDIQGGCERIKATPIPYSYTVLIHRIVAVYCFGLPFGLVDDIPVLTPVVVAFIAYAFFGLDALGDEIEEPFGKDPSDLPLGALSRMIEVNVRQTIGESEDLPSLLKPVDDVLS